MIFFKLLWVPPFINQGATNFWLSYIFAAATPLAIYPHLPWGDHEEVHEVPGVPHVTSLVQHEAQGQNLCTHLSCEHHHEDNLELLL